MKSQEALDSSLLSSKSETSTSQATYVLPPVNKDEEVLKSRYGSFWENPNHCMEVTNPENLLNSSAGIVGGNMGSRRRDPPEWIQMNPTSGDFGNNNDESFLSLKNKADMQWLLQNPNSQMGEGGYGTNTCGHISHPCGSIESMMQAKIDREKIKMVPSPRSRVVNRDQWPIKKIMTPSDVNLNSCAIRLSKNSFEPYFQNHLPEADFQKLATKESGITVNVYDDDTKTIHELRLVLRNSQYVLLREWGKDFIARRGLKEGQEIGFYWDTSDSMLHFTVLDYAYGKPI